MRVKLNLAQRRSLVTEIWALKNPTPKQVKQMYGTFGLDIHENKTDLSILTPKEKTAPKKFLNALKIFLGLDSQKYDYKPNDTMRDVLMKYIHNKETVKTEEITEKFGEKGTEELHIMAVTGFVKKVFPAPLKKKVSNR